MKEQSTASVWNPHPRIPVYVDTTVPKMHDPAMPQSSTTWKGSNNISFELLRCVEAIRDLTRILESISLLDDPLSDKRLVKALATPLYNLVVSVQDMFNELEGNVKQYSIISAVQHEDLRKRKDKFANSVPTNKGSALRDVRDKLDSHIDKDTVLAPKQYWSKVDLTLYFRWLKLSVEEFMHLLTLDVYSWTRDSGRRNVCSLMTVDGSVVDLYIQNGEPVGILGFTFAKSPKYGIADEMERLVILYNKIAGKMRKIAEPLRT